MIFGEALYFVFLPVAALVFHALPSRVRPWWLFASGAAVYAYYSPAFIGLLLVETVLVYGLARASGRRDGFGAGSFMAALAVTLGVLGVFKYAGLIDRTARSLLPDLSALPSFPQLYLPLAVSFFTFEFVHYVVDARRDDLPRHGLAEFLAFAMFFPTMVAGPIKRFQSFQPQLGMARLTAEDVGIGTQRIVIGLAKKTLIADTAALWVGPLLSTPALRAASRTEIVIALASYSVKIYFDFSGYSDIAIGSARLFGVRVPENFSWPYLRTSIASFWRHWHMSLTSWITDYVYKPLGGNRHGMPRTLANIVLAMLVSGLWHGAAWHFAAWGLYHGLLMAGHRVWQTLVAEPLTRARPQPVAGPVGVALVGAGRLGGWALTFAAVTLGWGLFVMPLSRFIEMLGRLT